MDNTSPVKRSAKGVGPQGQRETKIQGDGVKQNALALTTKETCRLLGGISARSLRRLEQRGLLLPSRGLRTKLYSLKAIEQYLEETK